MPPRVCRTVFRLMLPFAVNEAHPPSLRLVVDPTVRVDVDLTRKFKIMTRFRAFDSPSRERPGSGQIEAGSHP